MEFTKIISSGYSCDDLVYLQSSVVNMWESIPQNAVRASKNGHTYIFEIYVKNSSNGHIAILITEQTITENIKKLITEKFD